MGREEPSWGTGSVGMIAARERGDINRVFKKKLMVTRSLIDRLGLEKELHGHMGCVNCLEWNRDGSILASASDDLHVILWDPFRYKQLHKIATGHTGNIFSVKFVTPDVLATCAADGTVRVRSIHGTTVRECSCHCGRVKRLACRDEHVLYSAAEDGLLMVLGLGLQVHGTSVRECSCHCGRVKRLACRDEHVLYSAAEDGLLIQHDLRAPHRCNAETPAVLVSLLNHLGRHAEAKCVAVNPRRPHQLALGANDFYVRVYDTRMIKLGKLQGSSSTTFQSQPMWERQNLRCSNAGHGDPDNNIPRAAVQYYAPGHLSMEPNDLSFPKKSTTYVAFSDDGNELLVNLGCEQVYLFDLYNGKRPVLIESFIIEHNHGNRDSEKLSPKNGTNGTTGTNGTIPSENSYQLPKHVLAIKEEANTEVNRGDYLNAIELYNVAIAMCPDCAILYSNRAVALMRRGWSGDIYAAIRDCYKAISLDPTHVKSHFRLAKGLMDMKKAREAQECLLYFKDRFPRHAKSHAVFLLEKDINSATMDARTDEDTGESVECQTTSPLERQLRASATDYSARFLGHCNTTTDIKEVNFLGPAAEYLAAGSDDGSMFIWCRRSGNIVRSLRADESIVNCIQMHPETFLLASSGIESVVRLWSPRPEDGCTDGRVVKERGAAASANQQRMRSDPFEAMLLNISFASAARDHHEPNCRAA